MARSYFNRILPGGTGRTLIPPRPVSNLWKSARIDSLEAEAPREASERLPFRGESPPSPVVAPMPAPVSPAAFATRPRAGIAGPQRTARRSSRPAPGVAASYTPGREDDASAENQPAHPGAPVAAEPHESKAPQANLQAV